MNARKIVQTKTFTNEKVQKFKGVENFHAGYMDFMSGDLLHMYTGKFNGGNAKPSLPVGFCVWQARNICTQFFLQTVSTL